jgi:SNF2 family DNA or RNA helicase
MHRTKLDAVEADLGDIMAAREKVVIFHRFHWEADRYAELARKMSPVVFTINGATSAKDADESIRAFRARQGAAIAVVQIQAGGTGTDFATATHAMFVSDGFSYADRKQAEDRIYSPGKCRVITTYTMAQTIDEYVAEVLSAKGDIATSVRNADRASMVLGFRVPKRRAVA